MLDLEQLSDDATALVKDNPISNEIQRFDVDFGAKLYSASNLYSRFLGNNVVLFSPDHSGYPIMVDKPVYEAITLCKDGLQASNLMQELCKHGLEADECITAISTMEDRGFLGPSAGSPRNAALPFFDAPDKLEVWLHINNHCNLDCDYCFVDKFQSEMSSEVIDKVIGHLQDTCRKRNISELTVKFAGGEPALSVTKMSEFSRKLEASLVTDKTRIRWSMLSNGTVASKNLINFISERNVSLNISLDGYGSDGHDIYRRYKGTGKGSWNKIRENIGKFIAQGIRPNINATLSVDTVKTLPDLTRWAMDLGLNLHFSLVRETVSPELSLSEARTTYDAKCDIFIEEFERAFKVLENENVEVDPERGIGICELSFERPSRSTCCGIGSSHIVIQDDGDIASCPMTIREQSAVSAGEDLVNSARSTVANWKPEVRNESTELNCLDCRWFSVCTSGCPVANERTFGVPFTISPHHKFYEYIIPRYIDFYGRKLLQAAQRKNIRRYRMLSREGVIL